jgi:hypothetical protein
MVQSLAALQLPHEFTASYFVDRLEVELAKTSEHPYKFVGEKKLAVAGAAYDSPMGGIR